MIIPNVVGCGGRADAGLRAAADCDSDGVTGECGGAGEYGGLDEDDGKGEDGDWAEREGAPGTEHIMTSRTGEGDLTRLGQRTTVRLRASMRFVADRRETSCIKSINYTISLCCSTVSED